VTTKPMTKEQQTKNRVARFRATVKILLTLYQIISTLPSTLDFDFPIIFQRFAIAMSFVSLDFVQFLPIDCSSDFNFYSDLLVTTLTPIIITAALFGLYKGTKLVQYKLRMMEQANMADTRNPRRLSHRNSLTQIRETISSRPPNELKLYYEYLFLLLTFTVLPSVSVKIMQFFVCKEFDEYEGQTRFLRADFSINCDSSRYLGMKAYAVLMVLLYPIGIPVLYFYRMFAFRKRFKRLRRESNNRKEEGHASNNNSEQGNEALLYAQFKPYTGNLTDLQGEHQRLAEESMALSFLYEAYEERYWWWEVFECVRRLLLTGILVFFEQGSTIQIVVGCLIALLSIKMYSSCRPFVDHKLDPVAETAQWQVFLTLFAALCLRAKVSGDSPQEKEAFGVLLVLLNTCTPVGVTVMPFMSSFKDLKKKLKEKGAKHLLTVAKQNLRKVFFGDNSAADGSPAAMEMSSMTRPDMPV